MKIAKIHLSNFRSIEDLSMDIGDRITLLVGKNGSGKSNILDGMAVGLGAIATLLPRVAGISFLKSDLRQINNRKAPYTRVELTTSDGLVWDRSEKRDHFTATLSQVPKAVGLGQLKKELSALTSQVSDHETMTDLPFFVYYGVSRAVIDVPLTRKGFPKSYTRFNALDDALRAGSRFRSAFKWFYAKEQEELRLQREHKDFEVRLPELQAVREAIELSFPGISKPRIETNPLRMVVDQGGESFNITQLSDGYKTMLALIIDLTSRLAIANPHRKTTVLHSEGLVMIDEIDLHLHPEWQKRILEDLLRVFPKLQFILTTHSPYVVESLNNLILKDSQKDKPSFNQLSLFETNSDGVTDSVRAYLLNNGQFHSIIDDTLGLLDNSFLDTFNEISRDFNRIMEQ